MAMNDYSPPPLLEVQLHSGREALIDFREVVAVAQVQWPDDEGAAVGDCAAAYLRSGPKLAFSSPGYAEVKAAWKATLR